MKSIAAIHLEHGKPLVVDEIEIPDPQPDQVAVKLYSSGVCHSQLHQMHNPETPRPALLGHEGTGVVTRVGKDIDHVKEGDLVIVTWVPRDPIRGRWTPGPSGATYREQPLSGPTFTWGEDVLIHNQYVVKIDDDNPKDVSSIVGCAILTGAGAVLHTAKVRPEDSVAVYGVGGVGISAIKMASILEAYPIIAVDLHDDKLEFAKEFGATHTVNASKVDPVEAIHEITSGGVDYAFDAIGLRITNEQILPSVRGGGPGADNVGGMAVLVGMPGNEMTIWPGHFMFHQRQYRGSLGATYPDRDFAMYLRWHKEGKFPLDKLVTKRYRLDEINQACDDLEAGQIKGRAILEYT
ncbi:MAG: zinc-binding dehydrogenase [Dehalococcoidia bacterium]